MFIKRAAGWGILFAVVGIFAYFIAFSMPTDSVSYRISQFITIPYGWIFYDLIWSRDASFNSIVTLTVFGIYWLILGFGAGCLFCALDARVKRVWGHFITQPGIKQAHMPICLSWSWCVFAAAGCLLDLTARKTVSHDPFLNMCVFSAWIGSFFIVPGLIIYGFWLRTKQKIQAKPFLIHLLLPQILVAGTVVLRLLAS